MAEKFRQMKATLESGGSLSKSDKASIKAEYKRIQGTELEVKNCPNCWHDALIIIITKLSKNVYFMKAGCVEIYDGVQYTRHNITDTVAEKIISENPDSANKFYKNGM